MFLLFKKGTWQSQSDIELNIIWQSMSSPWTIPGLPKEFGNSPWSVCIRILIQKVQLPCCNSQRTRSQIVWAKWLLYMQWICSSCGFCGSVASEPSKTDGEADQTVYAILNHIEVGWSALVFVLMASPPQNKATKSCEILMFVCLQKDAKRCYDATKFARTHSAESYTHPVKNLARSHLWVPWEFPVS